MKTINGVQTVRVAHPFTSSASCGWASYDGDKVRVWDSIAGYFTTCHNLTPAQERSVRSRLTR